MAQQVMGPWSPAENSGYDHVGGGGGSSSAQAQQTQNAMAGPAPNATPPGQQNGPAAGAVAGVAGAIGSGIAAGVDYISGKLTGPDDTTDPPSGVDVRGGGGSSGGGGSTGGGYNVNTNLNMPSGKTPEQIAAERAALSAALNPEWDPAQIDRVNYYDKQPMVDLMTQEIEAERQRYNNAIDRNMDTAARDLNRALTDAQDMYQKQQNQITAEEMQARDNAALYAEARGDKGGIGQAQYNSIQNTAAQNRLQVRNAQTKLATDTARQISDLRAQGEFERADKMLELTQNYLSQLRQIEEYAANYNLSVDQINTAIAEWEYEYNQAAKQFATNTELSLAQLTGSFNNGTPTYAAQQETNQTLANIALNLIQAGVKPTQLSPAQLAALQEYYGMNQTGINQYYKVTN